MGNSLGRREFLKKMAKTSVAARKGKWKLVGQIENTKAQWDQTVTELKDADLELYNLEEDISESNNLREKNPKEYLELKKELIAFFENIK